MIEFPQGRPPANRGQDFSRPPRARRKVPGQNADGNEIDPKPARKAGITLLDYVHSVNALNRLCAGDSPGIIIWRRESHAGAKPSSTAEAYLLRRCSRGGRELNS